MTATKKNVSKNFLLFFILFNLNYDDSESLNCKWIEKYNLFRWISEENRNGTKFRQRTIWQYNKQRRKQTDTDTLTYIRAT